MERVKTGHRHDHKPSYSEQGKWVHADESSLRFKGTAHVGDSTHEIPLRGLFDTGSERNLVSLSFLHKHGIYEAVVRKLPHPETIKGAEKMMQAEIEYEASLQWCMDGSNIRTDVFSVIDNDGDSFDILLGWGFITENEIFAVKKKAPDRVRFGGGVTKQARQAIREMEAVLDQQKVKPEERELGQYQDDKDMSRMGGSSTATTAIGSPNNLFGTSPPGAGLAIFPATIARRHTRRSESPPNSPAETTPPHNTQPTPKL